MGLSIVQIASVASGVLVLILITVSCALPSWTIFYATGGPGVTRIQLGLWKTCVSVSGQQACASYDSVGAVPSSLQVVRALTVISCMLTYAGFILLLLMIFGGNFVPILQDEEKKPKIRLGFGVGLLLAGLMVIIAISLFPSVIGNNLPGFDSSGLIKGAGIFVGWVAGVLLLSSGSLLCHYRNRDIL